MFIGNRQKEAMYLSSPVYRRVKNEVWNSSRYFDDICWRIFYRSRYNVVQIEVCFVSTGRDSDKLEKVNISIQQQQQDLFEL